MKTAQTDAAHNVFDERHGTAMSPYHYEILKSLAWLAPLKTDQLQRMVAPGMHLSAFRNRLLLPMQQRGVIACVDFLYTTGKGHRDPTKRQPPRKIGKVWTLTAAGFADIAAQGGMPRTPAKVRLDLLEHDLMTSEVVTRIIEWSRPMLSAIYLDHEVRLDETRRRPIADAMLVVRYAANPLPGQVPWMNTPPEPGESVRLYAVEIDRGTEDYSITNDKALNYRRVEHDPTFYERYGGMYPVIVVVVPTDMRRKNWHTGWKERWPTGKWLITTDADLLRDQWLEFNMGRERLRTFVDGWQPGQDVRKGNTTTATVGSPIPPSAGPQKPRIIRLPDI
jgi:hypothetical protein